MTDVDPTVSWVGPHGLLEPIAIPGDWPSAATTTYMALITAPVWHPVWSQYFICVADLTPKPDTPDATLHFPGATHELLVFAINPDHGTLSTEGVLHLLLEGTAVHLEPVNVVHQFTATDDEIRTVAWLCGRAVTQGQLNPETGDAPSRIREEWLQACVQTLAHLRGEEHAGHGN